MTTSTIKYNSNTWHQAQHSQQEVKVIWQKAPHGGPIPRLGVTPGVRNLYHWIPGVGFPISPGQPQHHKYQNRIWCSIVTIGLGCTVWPQCTRVTADQRRHDTAYLNKHLFY